VAGLNSLEGAVPVSAGRALLFAFFCQFSLLALKKLFSFGSRGGKNPGKGIQFKKKTRLFSNGEKQSLLPRGPSAKSRASRFLGRTFDPVPLKGAVIPHGPHRGSTWGFPPTTKTPPRNRKPNTGRFFPTASGTKTRWGEKDFPIGISADPVFFASGGSPRFIGTPFLPPQRGRKKKTTRGGQEGAAKTVF